MIGYNHFEKQKIDSKSDFIKKISDEIIEVINYFSYEMADLKTLLFDLNGCVRGIGGSKQGFKVENLPSMKKANKEKNKLLMEGKENETPEEKLARHKAFFESLKSSFNQ